MLRKTETNVDMSHQNSIKYKFEMLKESIQINGFIPTLMRIYRNLNYKIKGVDFSTQNIYDLTLTGDYKEHGTALVSTSMDFLKKVISDLEEIEGKKIDKELFLDYGSGKGGAIIHARYLGFKNSVGIEFAKELNDIAIQNISKLGLDHVKSIYQDATLYSPPLNSSVIYIFNPFDEVVMQKVVENILALKDKFEKDPYIIYGNPTCTVLDKYFKFIKEIRHQTGAVVRYYRGYI